MITNSLYTSHIYTSVTCAGAWNGEWHEKLEEGITRGRSRWRSARQCTAGCWYASFVSRCVLRFENCATTWFSLSHGTPVSHHYRRYTYLKIAWRLFVSRTVRLVSLQFKLTIVVDIYKFILQASAVSQHCWKTKTKSEPVRYSRVWYLYLWIIFFLRRWQSLAATLRCVTALITFLS